MNRTVWADLIREERRTKKDSMVLRIVRRGIISLLCRAHGELSTLRIVRRGVIYIFLLITIQVFFWTVILANPRETAMEIELRQDSTERMVNLVPNPEWSDRETRIRQNMTIRYLPSRVHFHGSPRNRKGFLTIGIPSINRRGVESEYLKQTVSSLLMKMAEKDKDTVTILIYVADFDKSFQAHVLNYFTETYTHEMHTGLILIVMADPNNYPPLVGIQRNYNDSEERVKWRSKQVVDFAFMFHYGQNLSQYYIQIEDDVIAAKDYVRKIRDYIEEQQKPWVTLQFCLLGFIGKLYRSTDLPLLYDFLMLFYDQMPVDWLYELFAKVMARPKMPMRKPTLFQHKGLQSSFNPKEEVKLYDGYFEEDLIPKIKSDNPAANICTNIKQFGENKPAAAYNTTWPFEFFWGEEIKENDYFTLQFDAPQDISEVQVLSGHPNRKKEMILFGVLEFGYSNSVKTPENCSCDYYVTVATFSKGRTNTNNTKGTFNNPVTCVRIRFTRAQEKRAIIYNIIVKNVT